MFDIGFWELALIAVISLVILGPERLPRVARQAGIWVGKMKRMVSEVKTNINQELEMEDLRAIKKAGQDFKRDLSEGLRATSEGIENTGREFQRSVENDKENDKKESVDIADAIKNAAPGAGDNGAGGPGAAKSGKTGAKKKRTAAAKGRRKSAADGGTAEEKASSRPKAGAAGGGAKKKRDVKKAKNKKDAESEKA